MLNKLLKRCMPWMDKGRWYHISAISRGDTVTVKYDNALIDDVALHPLVGITEITLNLNGLYSIIDTLTFISKNTDPLYTSSIMINNAVTLTADNELLISAYHTSGNDYETVVDYWIFARRM